MPYAFKPNISINKHSLASNENYKIESYPRNLIAIFSLNSVTFALILFAVE